MGRLRKKIQCQESDSVSQPPKIGPSIGATTMPSAQIPIARPRFSGGKDSSITACETGCMAPPDSPCRTRKRTSAKSEVAKPQSTDVMVKPLTDSRRRRRRPILCASQPASGSTMALATR